MTVLALRLAAATNGVSRLHGSVSREMWERLWPGVPQREVPIGHVTNGVHFRSWISYEMNQLYDRYLGPRWREDPGDEKLWRRIDTVPAEELWRTHERRRERLVAFARRRLRAQLVHRSAPRSEIDAAEEVLDPEALTIGFARRFASYKRATLLLRDLDRLRRILGDNDRPVQILYAGKAHPKDDPGKELIRQIVALARDPTLRRRVVFLENYDMAVARYLLQGVDVWLNTPRRPLEASGTSGMKALANGALNLSCLDGWWDEAWELAGLRAEPVGWAIGKGENYENTDYQDQVEAEALYDLLERDVIPTFYTRGDGGIPRDWVARMKSSIRTLGPLYNTHRMVKEYAERFYIPAHGRYNALTADGAVRAREFARWLAQVRHEWPRVRLTVTDGPGDVFTVGNRLNVRARVELGALTPDDVVVEVCVGRLDAKGEIAGGHSMPMRFTGARDGAAWIFESDSVCCTGSGLHGYTARVLPAHDDHTRAFIPGLIAWAGPVVSGAAG